MGKPSREAPAKPHTRLKGAERPRKASAVERCSISMPRYNQGHTVLLGRRFHQELTKPPPKLSKGAVTIAQ